MTESRPDLDHDAVLASNANHLVVTAPPGTGKTFLSVRLAGHLAKLLAPGEYILLMTFSTQARTQLEREAANQLPPEIRRRIEITNYHRFFWQGVNAYRRALGLPMHLDIGSRRRREEALMRVHAGAAANIKTADGLVESLAEHAFSEFHDYRTPDRLVLQPLLTVVREEQLAGRLVFDDLGALFWTLLTTYPAVDQAYRSRYPIVIADEHQDASALQDAVVRHLARRLVVFADPMQLIHEFRGASGDRLAWHCENCEEELTLRTPHRWHGSEELAQWLVALRHRLMGTYSPGQLPSQIRIDRSIARRGFNGMKPLIRDAVSRSFRDGARTVAVLARGNEQVAQLRSYLCCQGQFPRQIGSHDFEEAREDIEQLPLLTDPQTVARHAVNRLKTLVPTVQSELIQVERRVGPSGINLKGARETVSGILQALHPIYSEGSSAYFKAVTAALECCANAGHHLPRVEAVRALRTTAGIMSDEPSDLDLVLEQYSAAVMAATYTALRIDHGLFVMTAHQAKGKEFDVVVLSDASARYWDESEDTRRLFYVAMTRAGRSWTVVAPDSGGSPLLRFLTE